MKPKFLLSLVIATTFSISPARAGDTENSGHIELRLEGAVAQPTAEGVAPSKPAKLDVYTTCEKGVWSDVWAESNQINRAIHLGEITDAAFNGDAIRFKVSLLIGSDRWVSGGPAAYEVELKRDPKSHELEGTFTGTFASPSKPVFAAKGRAHGTWLPPIPIAPGFEPVKPGEHPRLLFRKSELPALQEKMKTPFGAGMVEKLKAAGDPVSLGLLYQITGDKSYAERAKPATVAVMDNRNGGPFALGRFWGYRTSVTGAAYDLCYDAWEPEFREKVENYLDWIIYKCLNRQNRVGTVNWEPGSNYTVVIHPGNGIGALALLGEKGRPIPEPLPPLTEAPRIAAPADFKPAAGVPVVKLESGKMPGEWLWIGPFEQHVVQHDHPYFDFKQPVDCLASAGGMEKIRPEPGQKVSFKSQTLEWQPLPAAMLKGENNLAGKSVIASNKLSGRENTHLFFYTVVENEKPGYYRIDAPFYEGKIMVNGQRLNDGEFVFLEKGQFPLLVPVVMPDGEYSASCSLTETTEADATTFYKNAARQPAYEANRKKFQEAQQKSKAANGADPAWIDYSDKLRHWNYRCLRNGMGEGGFQGEGEGYTLECHHVIHDYACGFENMFGHSVTGFPDISHFAARYIATGVWVPHSDSKGPREKIVSQSFGGHGGGTIPARYFGRSIALCPKEWQPVLLWHWLKLMNSTPEEIATEAGVKQAFSHGYSDPFDLVQAYINFPLGLKPAAPDQIFPHAWEAKTRGFYAFRNNWSGPDSIVAQAFAKAGASCGWSQAEGGCFQIYGLGHEWAWKDNDAIGKTGSRWLDNVVMLPDDPISAGSYGKVDYFSGDAKTGSGTVTFDLSDLYQHVRKADETKGAKNEKFDGGIRGWRSFAADYSGKSGAPGLFAVADKITGGKSKIWMWQLPRGARAGEECKVEIEGNSFVLAYKDASMRVTFVGPKGVKITRASGVLKANPLSGIPDAPANAIHVTGEDPTDGNFFAVMTLQKGPAPEVKIEDGKARIGGQTVSFDGTKISIQ